VLVGLAVAVSGCVFGPSVGGSTLGRRTTSGLVRLSESSFGLIVYPCLDNAVSRVVLSDVDVDGVTRVVLEEEYPDSVHPRDLIVSTDPAAEPAVPGGSRQIVDAELLDRFNTDETYLTTIELGRYFNLEAFSPAGADVSGGMTLRDRFAVGVGRVSGLGLDEVRLEEVRCPDQERPAWNAPVG
jgi:hypothetical protein